MFILLTSWTSKNQTAGTKPVTRVQKPVFSWTPETGTMVQKTERRYKVKQNEGTFAKTALLQKRLLFPLEARSNQAYTQKVTKAD